MTMPRAHLVEPWVTRWYHCVTRCVRRAFLLSEGPINRRESIELRLQELAKIVAIAVGPVALERLVLRVKARFRDLFFDWTEIEYRQMLIDLIDENVLALQAKLEWHKRQNARCGGDRKSDELAFDYSPRGASMRQYELRCKTSFERGWRGSTSKARQGKGCCGNAWRGARTKSGGGNEGRKERRPTVIVTARSETCVELPMAVASSRAMGTLAELARGGMGTDGAEAGCFRYPSVCGVPSGARTGLASGTLAETIGGGG